MAARDVRSIGFDAAACRTTLFGALLDTIDRLGRKRPALVDVERKPLSYGDVVLGSLVLGQALARSTRRLETVGVLLPNANAAVLTLFGLNAFGRVPALLNFSAGSANLVNAVKIGAIRRIVTSRRFIRMAELGDTLAALEAIEVAPGKRLAVTYLEDVRATITTLDKARGFIRSRRPRSFLRRHSLGPDQPGVVLFTSGTEGTPKGVVLTNANLVANARQIAVHAANHLGPADIVFNPLPLFHSYGLTAATLFPLFSGMKVVLYPSPLHYKEIPKGIGAAKATILFATDTFLQGYARAADPKDLGSVRFVIAGAERIKAQTRAAWARYGTTILEGYGATECGPVITCSLPEHNAPGTVGPLLPGLETHIEPVAGLNKGGVLHVRGPNVMAGYLTADRPGVLTPTKDGWHDTGDIVEIDETGLVAIKGRCKRFAKIGGEMVSLAAVEAMAASLWPETNSVVMAVPDARKGEQLVLLTERRGIDRSELIAGARLAGLPELSVPRTIMIADRIPVLATGKIDFVGARRLLDGMMAQAS